jgi:hypothetical protein
VQYPFEREWSIASNPISRYPRLVESWAFTAERLRALRASLAEAGLPESVLTVATAGSLGRMEASQASDADLIVLLREGVDSTSPVALQAHQTVLKLAEQLGFESPNPIGVFGTACTLEQICGDSVGKADEPMRIFGKRLLLLLETQPVFADGSYEQVLSAIVRRYSVHYVAQDPKKEWTFLVNDLIRYFRSLCVNYQWDFERDPLRWSLRNVKLRHSRLIMYCGLLALLGEASKERHDKVSWLSERLKLTPMERLSWVYAENRDYNFHRVAGLYNSFLVRLGDPEVRGALRAMQGYSERFRSEVYAELKASSDALVAELLRFVLARRADWSERFFEYLIF